MRRFLAITFAFIMIVSAGMVSLDEPVESTSFLVGGIQVNEPDHDEWAEALKSSGMNTVSVTVYAKQGDWESDNLWYEKEEPAVLSEIRTARAHGLEVVLILRVALDHAYERNAFFWHGMILPKSDELLYSWFDKYGKFVEKWSRIAEEEGIDILAIASEMNALSATLPVKEIPNLYNYYLDSTQQANYKQGVLSHREKIGKRQQWKQGNNTYPTLEDYLDARSFANAFWAKQHSFQEHPQRLARLNERNALLNQLWISTIEKSRTVYSGKLTYAANFDNYQEVGFWPYLDFIGVNAYFPLRNKTQEWKGTEEDVPMLTESWKRIFGEVETFKSSQGIPDMPLLFTELGYTYRNQSTLQPWSSFGFSILGDPLDGDLILWDEEPLSYEERTLAVKALYEAHSSFNPSPLAGLLYWKFTTKEYHYPIEPFVVQIGADSKDPMLPALAKFNPSPGS